MRQLDLTGDAYQSFLHNLDGIELHFVIAWNETAQMWALDIYDYVSGDLLHGGAAIVSGPNILQITPNYNLFALFLNRQGVIADPKRDTLASGILYLGVKSELPI